MKTDPPFTAHGDEPIEARIVSWVLGEASDFEAAELKRLCEERPELLIFRQRIREIHGLLGEDEHPIPPEIWKLPPEKRQAIEELFGEEPVRLPVPKNAMRIRRRIGKVLLAAAACVLLSLMVVRFYPFQEQGRVVIEVKPRIPAMSPMSGQAGARRTTPQWFSTEFEKIESREAMKRVVDRLDLAKQWNVDEETAIRRVRDKVQTKQIRDTDLIEIRAKDPDETNAKRIAHEVALAYRDYRNELERRDSERAIAELNKAVRDLEDKVEDRRKVLTTIARTKRIIYKGEDSDYGRSGVDEDQGARDSLHSFYQLEQEKMQLESQINSLQKYDNDQLMVYASGLDLPDNIIRNVYPQYLEAKRSVETLKAAGAGERHPTVLAAKDQISNMKQQLDDGVTSLRATLQAQLDLANERMKSAEVAKNEDVEDAVKRGLDAQDYVDAKRDFETDQELLQNLKLKLIGETVSSNMPRESVEIHEDSWDGESTGTAAALASANDQSKRNTEAQIVLESAPMQVREMARESKRIPAKPSAPSAPSSSAARPVLAGSTAGSLEVPLPELADAETASLSFGDADDFGAGWGGQDEGAKGNGLTSGLRSGDSAITRNSIDAILNSPEPAAPAPEQRLSKLAQREIISRRQRGAAGGKEGALGMAAPAKGDSVPMADRLEEVDDVGRNLYAAEGNYNLGKFDDAKNDYENVLRKDPYNKAARRGLERLAQAKTDYYRAAYDHTRAELLAEVDKAWELALPRNDEKPIDQNRYAGRSGDVDGQDGELDAAKKLFSDAGDFAYYSRPGGESAGTEAGDAFSPKRQGVPDLDGIPTTGALFGRDFQPAGEQMEPNSALFDIDSDRPALPEAETTSMAEVQVREADVRKKQPEVALKPAPLPVEDETLATDDPYSTFSLNVSDASFQIAKAALAKGERPDPASIKPEQFYNAVDYQDPAPAAGEPVAVNIEQCAHPVVPGRNLVRIALKTAAAGRAASQPLRLTLLVDHSGSMVREDRRAALEQALAGLSSLLTENDRVTVIGFSRTPHLLADSLTGDKADQLADLIHLESSEGGTNLEEALKLGETLAQRAKLDGAQNRIVLFTDGAANLGNADPEKLAARIRDIRNQGLAIDIAGMAADDLNDNLLAELARNGNGRYHVVGKGVDGAAFAKQLAGAFRPAAENVKVQVRFNPERVGHYRLIGFEKDRLKTEDFRNDAVDAAEMAAEEAGVAIYQIEPLPNGSGEIGEVSVRFRDTAANAMVERAWTISHDANAPAFDLAAPSMQLAGLATLAAEKLRGGPAAEAIDFRKLAGVRARVKSAYDGSSSVEDLLEMIRSL
ncbi:MAG: von Willebrand factor type A domain-containing protein [Akkermansiaceae bacterium]|nr:von Willebrand factor type A domain-containing protein [Akkermansiaceae bacterium]